jgi:hypothetical protein
MKSKKFNNKLSLNKNTVANLNTADMDHAKGGGDVPTFAPLCETHFDTWCNGESIAFCDTNDGIFCPQQ